MTQNEIDLFVKRNGFFAFLKLFFWLFVIVVVGKIWALRGCPADCVNSRLVGWSSGKLLSFAKTIDSRNGT